MKNYELNEETYAVIGEKVGKTRVIEKEEDYQIAIGFFKELGDYAFSKNTVIGMEANPAIYNTNFINDTKSAIELIEMVDSKGFLLTEVSLKKSFESLTMSSFVSSHFMHCVMDSVKV